MTDFDAYGGDVLAGFSRRMPSAAVRVVEAERDLVVEESATGFVGAVLGLEGRLIRLEDRHGRVRLFPLGPGFSIDGEAVSLRTPKAKVAAGAGRTASGSIAVEQHRARVARASRIFVEGRHDAELVEKVWGSDLRLEGVVVEYLEGIDHLDAVVREFAPGPGRRIGVLVDHLVAGSKESKIADVVARGPFGEGVLVVGHPYVDVWQSIKPQRVGLAEWPVIPRTIEWKHGICDALGLPHETQADIAHAWQKILGTVRTYADLEPALLGRVEQLIDFVTADA